MTALMFNFSRALSLVALAAMVCCLSSTTALGAHPTITLVDDGFDDGGFTNGADPFDTEWYALRATSDGDAAGPYTIVNDPVIGGGNAFMTDDDVGRGVTGFTADLPGATGGAGNVGTGNNGNGLAVPNVVWQLVNAGDFIRLQFDYRLLGTLQNRGDGFRFGFANRLGTGDSTAFPNGQFDDQSFYSRSGTGTDLNLDIRQEFGDNNRVLDGSDILGAGFDVPGPAGINSDDSLGTASIELTKLANGNIRADVDVRGNTVSAIFGDDGPGTDATNACNAGFCTDTIDSFDFFAIGMSHGNNADGTFEIVLDNVLVTTNGTQIPEPASLGLLGMGLAAMTLRRRR